MVKYLGEQGEALRGVVAAAVSVSNPWCFMPHIESLHYTKKPGGAPPPLGARLQHAHRARVQEGAVAVTHR